MVMKQNPPVQQLLFFVAQDFDNETRTLMLNHVRSMVGLRDWVIDAPEPIDEGGENPILGGVLKLHSAIPFGSLPLETDRKHLEEVKAIVKSLTRLSHEHTLAIEFELDGEFVGSIEDGKIDRSLETGLIGEWERLLNSNLDQ